VKTSELKRWLSKNGCTFHEGTRHTVVFYQGRSTTLPRHASKEIAPGTVKSILVRLGLRMEK
jgi:mRNA interferase HicA